MAFGKRWDSLVRGSDVRHDRIDRWLGVRGITEFSGLSLCLVVKGNHFIETLKFTLGGHGIYLVQCDITIINIVG